MGLFNNSKIVSGLKKLGVNIDFGVSTNKVDIDNISTIQTCVKILTENVSRLPVLVRDKTGQAVENHIISKIWNRSFNGYISSDSGRKLVERDRLVNGNGFARMIFDQKGNITGLIPYNYDCMKGIVLKNGSLYYAVDNSFNPFIEKNNTETINSEEILHFKTAIQNGYVGISPIKSLVFEAGIRQKASQTMTNFYENNAMSPVVLSSAISDLSQVKAINEFTEKFQLENTGSSNAGKIIKLPPGMRLDALDYRLIDADIINTLKFTNSEIISAFGVPSFLMSYETTQSIENQTLEFKTFTLNSILATYRNEIENKMLTTDEINKGYYIDFDYTILLEADIKTKATAYKDLVTNGLITHNEAIQRLGFKPIEGEAGKLHFIQMQYQPIEERKNTNTIENNE